MEHTHYKFNSIEQFRHQHKALKDFIYYVDTINDEVIFDYTRQLPVVTIECIEKIHGTYAGIVYANGEIYAQSRNNVIVIGADNAGFALFVEQQKQEFTDIFDFIKQTHELKEDDVIILSGEWAGGSIQKNSALSGVDKKLLLFSNFKVNHSDGGVTTYSTNSILTDNINIFNIQHLPETTFTVTVDFNDELSINAFLASMEQSIEKLEESSPTGRALGKPNNIGEGYVCTFTANNPRGQTKQFTFKCKGEKHSKSNISKTPSAKSQEDLTALNVFVDSICHSWRFEQGVVETCGNVDSVDIKHMGAYLKFVTMDTLKEEQDLIVNSGFEVKQIMQRVNDRAKKYFLALV